MTVVNWIPADTPPPAADYCWSAEVATVSTRGRVLDGAYFHASDAADGAGWQRPFEYEPGEQVAWWWPLPGTVCA